uniref:Uncharacterized protein n=1 Tax=Anguilla anguilla TaxID=7936 RepID=A0A0E9X7W1_ANGAN
MRVTGVMAVIGTGGWGIPIPQYPGEESLLPTVPYFTKFSNV